MRDKKVSYRTDSGDLVTKKEKVKKDGKVVTRYKTVSPKKVVTTE